MITELVSVIIPVYNGERFLAAALESVAAQDYRPLEVIVVDDGSTDSTAAIVAAFFQRTGLLGYYHYQDNQGPAAARNAGLKLATGAWVAFLDADDLWLPGKTTRQLLIFAKHPQAQVVWGDAILFTGEMPSAVTPAVDPPGASPMLLFQSMLFRRTILDQVGPFDPNLRLGEDVDWLLRAMEQGANFVIHPGLVVYYRRHAMNLTCDTDLTRRSLRDMIKRSIVRRRTQGAAQGNQLSDLLMLPRPPTNRRKGMDEAVGKK